MSFSPVGCKECTDGYIYKVCEKCGRLRPLMCNRCFGYGKLDWVEIIVGRHPPKLYYGNTHTCPSGLSTSTDEWSEVYFEP